MKIEKEYNVQMLANIVKEAIESSSTGSANINVITAQYIVDILETVASWENKRTEPTDIKKEELKKECFGCHINGDGKCNLCVNEKECMIETKRKSLCKENEENEWYECTGCYDGMSLGCRACEMKDYCKYEEDSCNE